jgi:competence protein ComEA
MFRLLAIVVSVLALTIGAAAQSGAPQKRTDAKTAAKAEAKKAGAAAAVVDINAATAEQLKTLPGIGDAYAKKIIDGRPYKMKNQLVTRNVLTQSLYDKIKDGIVAKQ